MGIIKQSDQQYLHKIENITFQPVFILGLHRSGTSILYKVLAATGCFNSVTAYHILKYHELIEDHIQQRVEAEKDTINELFKQKGVTDRGFDRLKVNADLEEEYCFLLQRHTPQMYLTSQNLPVLKELCKKIQFIAGNNKPILLKNPHDFPNYLFIKEMFPQAKFVFIQRHPYKTINSNFNALRKSFEHKNPYTAAISRRYEATYANPVILSMMRCIYFTVPSWGIFLITKSIAYAANLFLKNIEKLPKDDYITVTYEDLCKHPQKTVDTIMQALSLSPVTAGFNASSFIQPRESDIDLRVKKKCRLIDSSMKKYFERFNYTQEYRNLL